MGLSPAVQIANYNGGMGQQRTFVVRGYLVVVVVLIGGGSDFHSESTMKIILIKSQSDHMVV